MPIIKLIPWIAQDISDCRAHNRWSMWRGNSTDWNQSDSHLQVTCIYLPPAYGVWREGNVFSISVCPQGGGWSGAKSGSEVWWGVAE